MTELQTDLVGHGGPVRAAGVFLGERHVHVGYDV